MDAVDAEFGERAARAGYGVGEVGDWRVGDQFGEEGVEVWVGGVAGVAVAVGPDAGAGGRFVGGEHPSGGADLAVGLDSLHVDAGLDRVAARRGDIGLAEAEIDERLAGGDAQLRAHQIDADHFFGDGVLDLKARVGFDKREIALVVCVDEELERGKAAIANGGGDADGGGGEARSGLGAEERAGRPFDDFLVAALEAALALAEMGDGVAVADDLHLDVPGAGEQAFDDDCRVAKGRGGFGLAAGVCLFDLIGVGHDAHAASTAAGDGLDHHRAAVERFEKGARFAEADGGGAASQHGHAELFSEGARARFVAEELERLDGGADECDAFFDAAAGEFRAFGEETVAGVERVAGGRFGGGDDGFDVEIGARANGVERVRLVSAAHVQRGGVVLGVDGDGGDAQFARGAHDSDRDFAAVGDQQLGDGHCVPPPRG